MLLGQQQRRPSIKESAPLLLCVGLQRQGWAQVPQQVLRLLQRVPSRAPQGGEVAWRCPSVGKVQRAQVCSQVLLQAPLRDSGRHMLFLRSLEF